MGFPLRASTQSLQNSIIRLAVIAALAAASACGLDGRPLKRARMATAVPSPTTAPLTVPDSNTPAMPSADPDPASAHSVLPCLELHGTVRSVSAASTILNANIDYFIYLPPCYESQSATAYPVLYLFHGLDRMPDQWVALGLPGAADDLMVSGEIPPFLIVLPYVAGGDSSDAAFLADLLPAVDSRYRTKADRAFRSVGGISRGAEWALRLALRRADLFGQVGLHSIALSPNALPQIQAWAAAVPATLRPEVFADVGSIDPMRTQTEELQKLFEGLDWPRDFQILPGDHSDEYWKDNLTRYLRSYGDYWK
jgi:enterochelin esterase-like enzyme